MVGCWWTAKFFFKDGEVDSGNGNDFMNFERGVAYDVFVEAQVCTWNGPFCLRECI